LKRREGTDASSGLGKISDADRFKRNQGARTPITHAFGKEAPEAVADYAAGKAAGLRKQGNEDEVKKRDEGGVYRIAPHTAVGALAGGASTGAASSASVFFNLFYLGCGLRQLIFCRHEHQIVLKETTPGPIEHFSAR
jgi:hypothetical protein